MYFIIHACNHQSTESYVSSHPINIHPSCLAPVRYAHLKGIGDFTPQSFRSAEEAKYPCILKPKLGTFGKDTHVCRSMDEVKRFNSIWLGEMESTRVGSWTIGIFYHFVGLGRASGGLCQHPL